MIFGYENESKIATISMTSENNTIKITGQKLRRRNDMAEMTTRKTATEIDDKITITFVKIEYPSTEKSENQRIGNIVVEKKVMRKMYTIFSEYD